MNNTVFKRKKIGRILSDMGFIDAQKVEAEAPLADIRLGEWLINRGLINEEQLVRALAEQFELQYLPLADYSVPGRLFEKCGIDDIYRLGILPYENENGKAGIVIHDPADIKLINEVEKLYGTGIALYVSSRGAIRAALERSGAAARFLNDVSGEFKADSGETGVKGRDSINISDIAGQESSIEKFINTVLLVAMKKRASDIHFEVYEGGVKIKYRIDGILYQATENLDTAHHRAFITRLKVMAKLDIAENRIPQDGHFTLNINGKDTDFRVSILPAVFGEDVVIRILDKTAFETRMKSMSLETVGIEASTVKKLRKAVKEPYGMILITGPTGSGKTTTLYAALAEVNSGEEKIITVEDPVEYQINGIVQVPVNEKKKLTFAAGLRSILRHDPDKIVVGEIRDTETAQIAVQSALTGHLVFTTVHANNACDVIGRFNHMGINVHSFVSALNCVVAQRLMRNICPDCREKKSAESGELSPDEMKKYSSAVFYAGRGCPACSNTGYMGRSAIAEFMTLTPLLRSHITQGSTASELQRAAIGEGMITLRMAALEKAAKGETTLREVNRVTFMED
jgi:type IV pilus assembly protein PilB